MISELIFGIILDTQSCYTLASPVVLCGVVLVVLRWAADSSSAQLSRTQHPSQWPSCSCGGSNTNTSTTAAPLQLQQLPLYYHLEPVTITANTASMATL